MIVGCGNDEAHEAHGDCPGWPEEHVIPTEEQALGWLRSTEDVRALDFVREARSSREEASRCFIENHVHRLERTGHLPRHIGQISDWLDGSYPPDLDEEAHTWRRVTKVVEEVGEVWRALAGSLGENPRKGVTHEREDVVMELLDVAGAALGAVYYLNDGGNVVAALATRIAEVVERNGLAEAPPSLT